MNRGILTTLLAVLAVTAALLGWNIGEIATGSEAVARVHPDGFVGREACAACHPRETEQWLNSHHSKSMRPVEAGVLGRFDGSQLAVQGVTSTFFTKGGKPWVRTEGADGKPQDFAVAYSFGIHPLQQYLVALPGGKLQALPLAWDARPAEQGGQRWYSLYPDEPIHPGDPLHWTGRNQNWNQMCADCHSTGLRKNYDLATDSFATTASDIEVACESCHGPGQRHVDWVKDGAKQGDKGLAATGPETCAACHSRRRALADGATPDHTLLDSHMPALLDEILYRADGQILDEVFEWGSFLQSRMHAAGVTCTNCHSPHGGGTIAKGNQLCAQCHQPERYDTAAHHHHEGGEAAQCVTCHMPSRTYMGVHVRRDHSLRLPAPEQAAKAGAEDACIRCHQDKSPAQLAAVITDWTGHPARPGFAAALAAGRQGLGGDDLVAAAANAGNAGIVRATALSLLSRAPAAEAVAALDKALDDKDPLVRLGALRGLTAYLPDHRRRAAPLLDDPVKAVRMEAARLLAPLPASTWNPQEAQRLNVVLDEWVASELASAERPESHFNIATLRAEQGRAAEAEAAFRTALHLDPRFVPALLNLGDLYRVLGLEAEAEAQFRHAVAVAPDDADAHFALGLALIRQGRRADAMPPIAKAAALRPDDPRIARVHSLLRQGR